MERVGHLLFDVDPKSKYLHFDMTNSLLPTHIWRTYVSSLVDLLISSCKRGPCSVEVRYVVLCESFFDIKIHGFFILTVVNN